MAKFFGKGRSDKQGKGEFQRLEFDQGRKGEMESFWKIYPVSFSCRRGRTAWGGGGAVSG